MIEELEIKDFTVFPNASFLFGDKLNIIIGENSSGKTHLLKLLYSLINLLREHARLISHRSGNNESVKVFLKDVLSVFNVTDIISLLNWNAKSRKKEIKATPDELSNPGMLEKLVLEGVQSMITLVTSDKNYKYNHLLEFTNDKLKYENHIEKGSRYSILGTLPSCIFFPCRELLTIYPHYLSLRREFQLPYDSTYDDTIAKLGLPPRNNKSEQAIEIIQTLENAIDGKVFLKNEKFYYHPNNMPVSMNWEIDMVAEGWRKLGMILQLLQDGSLREGTVLLWDEPEANLNPQLIRLVAWIILLLSQMDIQIFLTTHSLFLVYELEMLIAKQKIKEGVRYFNLRKGKPVEQGNTFPELKNVLLVDESLKQTSQYLEEEF